MRIAARLVRRARWLAAVLFVALVIAPIASETAAEAAAEQACAVSAEHHDDAHRDGPSHSHRHHAHGCGSCHVHLFASAEGVRVEARPEASPQSSHASPAIVTGPSRRLFRPPRA